MGDVHGHLVPRPNVRSDGNMAKEGGLARMYTVIQRIRRAHRHTLLINTGDTIQGSAEALFTRGQAVVDVLNLFHIDVFAPGNWEFVYGTQRFLEPFGPENPKAPWNTIAANLSYDGEPYAHKTGQRVLPPYAIKHVGGLKVGILGITTDRGPQVVGTDVTKGFRFTKGEQEVAEFVKVLREQENVDLLIMASELGLANNIRLAEKYPGIDLILSSDMHEETRRPVLTKTGTLILEEGQDGTMLGELTLRIHNRRIVSWAWKPHTIHSGIPEDRTVAAKVAKVRKTFVSGPHFVQHVNPFPSRCWPGIGPASRKVTLSARTVAILAGVRPRGSPKTPGAPSTSGPGGGWDCERGPDLPAGRSGACLSASGGSHGKPPTADPRGWSGPP